MRRSLGYLIEGYQVFQSKYVSGQHSLMRDLGTYGQNPEVMIVCCADSRVDPALILQCEPGDIFVVRNVASLIAPYGESELSTSSAIEFAVKTLRIRDLIIMGHSDCGGIHTLLQEEQTPDTQCIHNWLAPLRSDSIKGLSVDDCVKVSLHQSYENCLTFPWVQEAVHRGSLTIHQWFFDIAAGTLYRFDEEENVYEPLTRSFEMNEGKLNQAA